MWGIGRVRARAAKQIDRLIELLDATQLDVDLEDGADEEPSLGSMNDYHGNGTSYAAGLSGDREEEHDGREPENEHGDGNPDDEPSLG